MANRDSLIAQGLWDFDRDCPARPWQPVAVEIDGRPVAGVRMTPKTRESLIDLAVRAALTPEEREELFWRAATWAIDLDVVERLQPKVRDAFRTLLMVMDSHALISRPPRAWT